jgi:hypothetical protein
MKPQHLKALAKMEQKPHTVDDSIAISAAGLRNLNQMREAFPDAFLEDVHGVGRVWVSESALGHICGFDCAPDMSGLATFVPYAEAGTIRVYLPSSHEKSRAHVNGMQAMAPELYQQIVNFLKTRA